MNDTTINPDVGSETSIFQSSLSVEAKIERARTELLDLSARNRLLNVPRFSKSAKTIDVVDEKSSEVFKILVTEGKAMTFLAGAKGREPKDGEGAEELIELALPDDEERDAAGRLLRHGDTKLQTRMTPNALQKRLLDLYFDARTLEEEQGVNILYLGLGTLKWVDPNNSENARYAPLILVPVALERGSAAERFKLRARPEDFASNLSLEAFLDRVHKISMPQFEPSEDFSFEEYARQVAAAISIKPTWSVQPDDIVLGFFSFAKFLMYRDLDPSLWPVNAKFTERPLITSLVSDGFTRTDNLLPDDEKIDRHISPSEMTHIVDADSSQTVAIHEARRGRDLVIQGPPGTGKSQTIANIIAGAVADGKTVLFVAEKMAALEVVKRRLDQAGIGDACLELHSNKANKRAVLAELQHVWELGAPKGEATDALDSRLLEARDRLNAHPERIHRIYRPYDLSPYQIIGHLSRLRRIGMSPSDIQLTGAVDWTPEARERIISILSELAQRIDDIGLPSQHAWFGVGLTGITPLDLERLTRRLADAFKNLASLRESMDDVTRSLHQEAAVSVSEFRKVKELAERVASCPEEISSTALSAPVWETSREDITRIIRDGAEFLRLSSQVNASLTEAAWQADPQPLLASFNRLPAMFPQSGFSLIAQIDALLPRFLQAAASLKQMLGVTTRDWGVSQAVFSDQFEKRFAEEYETSESVRRMVDRAMDQIERDHLFFEVAETAFALPAYFAAKVEFVRGEEVTTALGDPTGGVSRKHALKAPLDMRILTRTVATLDFSSRGEFGHTYTPPRFRVEVDGFWRRLPSGSVGKDAEGRPTKEKTWIHSHARWKDKPPKTGTVLVKSPISTALERARKLAENKGGSYRLTIR